MKIDPPLLHDNLLLIMNRRLPQFQSMLTPFVCLGGSLTLPYDDEDGIPRYREISSIKDIVLGIKGEALKSVENKNVYAPLNIGHRISGGGICSIPKIDIWRLLSENS